MKTPLILIGGGGHCKSCIDVIECNGSFEIKGILDKKERMGEKVFDYIILADDDEIPAFVSKGYAFHISSGQIKTAKLRSQIFDLVKASGGILPVIFAPTSHQSKHAQIGEGTILMHNTIVNASAIIGANCIINNGALIEHDTTVGDSTHVSTMAVVNGDSHIGSKCFIGSNSVVNHGVTITDNVIIGSGSVVRHNIVEPGIYAGNLLKRIA